MPMSLPSAIPNTLAAIRHYTSKENYNTSFMPERLVAFVEE
jgi:hypothetical protein